MQDTGAKMIVSLVGLVFLLLFGGGLALVVILLAKAVGRRGVLAVLFGMVAVLGIFAALLSVRVQSRSTTLVSRSNAPVNSSPRADSAAESVQTLQLPGGGILTQSESAGGGTQTLALPGGVALTQSDKTAARDSSATQGWTPSDQHAFEASVYPSASSAVVALSRAVIKKQLTDVMPAAIPLKRLLVSGNADKSILAMLPRDLKPVIPIYCPSELDQMKENARKLHGPDETGRRDAVFAGLRQGTPTFIELQAPATTQAEAAPLEPWEAQLLIDLTKDEGGASSGGAVTVTLRGSVTTHTSSAEYVDASWAENFNRWVQQHSDRKWVLGASEQLCANKQQAEQQALDGAISELQRRLNESLPDAFRGRHDPEWVRRQLATELRDGGFLHKTFLQPFQRPYGEVYRAAVLVDASPEKIDQIAGKYLLHAEVGRKRDLSLLASSAGLILVICVVYLFLNAATRGYYVWSMRAAAVVLASAGVVVLLKYM